MRDAVIRFFDDNEAWLTRVFAVGREHEATHPLVDEVVPGARRRVARGCWWRDHPGFDQRSCAKLGPNAFELVHQVAETPGEWRDDLRATYRRRA